MKSIFSVLATLLVFVFATPNNANAQRSFDPFQNCVVGPNGTCIPNTMLTAMPFLRIAPDARGGAMGDVGITMSADPNSLHYNASNLAFAEKSSALSLTYTPWLRELRLDDVYLLYLSGYWKLSENETLGGGLRFFSLGDITFTNEQGAIVGEGRPQELDFSLAYARKLGDNFSAAITAKYVNSNLATGQFVNGQEVNSANAFAADVSLTYRKPTKLGGYDALWTYGLALTNIGSKVSYTNEADVADFLPANFGIGAGLNLEFDKYNTMSFHLEMNKLMVPTPVAPTILDEDGVPQENPVYDENGDGIADFRQESLFGGMFGSFGDAQGGFSEEMRELAFSVGAEYWYDKQFAVRAGYFYENENKGGRTYLTLGIGVQYNIFGINLSYLVPTNNQRGPLDNTLRFSLIFDFQGYKEKFSGDDFVE